MSSLSPTLIDDQLATLEELYGQELAGLMKKGIDLSLPHGIKKIYAIGNGDSYHAANAALQAFASVDIEYISMQAYTFLVKEIARMKPSKANETLVVCISASGTSELSLDVLKRVKELGVGRTLSMTGRADCAMDKAAEMVLSTCVSEKGRSPGLRTFAASLCGLFALAAAFSKDADKLMAMQEQIVASAKRIPALLERSRIAANEAAEWNWQLAAIVGCDALLGGAQFIAAKLAEGCGVFAAAQEMEEWCHVESMTYPLDAPIILLQGASATQNQALKVSGVAHRAGHPVMIIAQDHSQGLTAAADVFVSLQIQCMEELLPLYTYIPGAVLSSVLAKKLGRAMFLSDQPIDLFG